VAYAVPWQCWDAPGFKSCNTEAGNNAYRVLQGQGVAVDSDLWKQLYPDVLSAGVEWCAKQSGCHASTMVTRGETPSSEPAPKSAQEAQSMYLAKTLTTEDPNRAWKILAGAGIVAVAGWFLWRKFK